jgi:hypothetical protein
MDQESKLLRWQDDPEKGGLENLIELGEEILSNLRYVVSRGVEPEEPAEAHPPSGQLAEEKGHR